MLPIIQPAVILLGLCSHLSLATGDAGQVSLQSTAGDDEAQIFTLRHWFHHDLGDPNRSSTVFASVASLRRIIHVDEFDTTAVARPIKVRNVLETLAADDASSGTTVFSRTVPNVTDKETIINLATMTSDAYYLNASDSGWLNLTQGYKDSQGFGYEKNGLRGHLFANQDNSTVIIAFKGSSIDPRDNTRTEDRLNDNLLFSCCCASQRPDPYWYGEVCHCREDVYRCNSTCIGNELVQQDRYYAAAIAIMHNVTQDLFPSAAVWTTGHSLGGSIASLMGLKFEVPAISFEAPPDRLAARRLGLVPKSHEQASPTWHVGNTADPVYMGACNGFYSSCAAAGYSFESQCFTGKRCIYDTVGDKGWRLNVGNHRVNTVITDVLEAYDTVPECLEEEDECVDCYNWRYDS